jgi:hypothetical protein
MDPPGVGFGVLFHVERRNRLVARLDRQRYFLEIN